VTGILPPNDQRQDNYNKLPIYVLVLVFFQLKDPEIYYMHVKRGFYYITILKSLVSTSNVNRDFRSRIADQSSSITRR